MIQYPNVVDGCFLRYEEEHPSFRPYSGLIMHAAGSVPDADQVRAQVAARIERMPTLAWRVFKQGRRTVWEIDPHFDPRAHVHEVRLDEGDQVVVSGTADHALDDAGDLAFLWASAVQDMWQQHASASSHESRQVPQTLA
ncbi:hypothetical protein PV726_20095 [Streptomyces europaeiscabiei]|uniref:hypothetical protein n=1 Tax=Streptomyces europaeiscabiei TaxID=146819 RepID=UPI0029B605D9|nr:hypothetical protein [Streptomyces europaeiscabiei]MDX3692603.1 hypothetical protein [Streptomyces europaeiscabiei]